MNPLAHPVYPLPTYEQALADPAAAEAYILKRNQLIELEALDPWQYGYKPDAWGLIEGELAAGQREILITGGNRASKSEYAGRKVIEVLHAGEKRRAWCLQTTEANSIEMQQPILYKYIPLELKGLKKGQVVNISYSQKNGFSENKFILPNGSECIFRNYAQEIIVVEGGDCDIIWCDELVPLSWIETIRYRLITRGGLLLITFTPIQGYTPTVKEFMDGARTIQWQTGELVGGKKLPRLQRCVRRGSSIVYFNTGDNPFGGDENIRQTLDGAPESEILTRYYGIPTKAIHARFPKFRENVHVLEPARIPKEGSVYQFADPASARNWFMIWVLVDARDRHFIYREWPCEGHYIPGVGDPGPWAEADGRKADGRPGSAQRSFGWGFERYAAELERLETLADQDQKGQNPQKEEVICRWMDSRFGNTPNLKNDAATTVLEEMGLLGVSFAPAGLDPIDEGISLINSLLDFDPESGKEPKLYISSECKAVIFALKVWTGKDDKLGACKDPIDCCRYMALAGLMDVGKSLQLVDPMGADAP